MHAIFRRLRSGTQPASHYQCQSVSFLYWKRQGITGCDSWRTNWVTLRWCGTERRTLRLYPAIWSVFVPARFSLIPLQLNSGCFLWFGQNPIRKTLLDFKIVGDLPSEPGDVGPTVTFGWMKPGRQVGKCQVLKIPDKDPKSAGGVLPIFRQVMGSTAAQKVVQRPNASYGCSPTYLELFPDY